MSASAEEFLSKGVLLFLNVPEGTVFGIDFERWNVGEKFKGIKMIPPGIHFVSYSVSPKSERNITPTTGFWIETKVGSVSVFEWNQKDEELIFLKDEDEISRYSAGVKRFEFDPYLGAYPMTRYKDWIKLTCFLNFELINSLEPISKKISSVFDQLDEDELKHIQTHPTFQNHQQPQQSRLDSKENQPKWTFIPNLNSAQKQRKQQRNNNGNSNNNNNNNNQNNLSAIDLLAFKPDKSEFVEKKLFARYKSSTNKNDDNVIGEMQFAFVSFLMGQSYDAFDQWKRILYMLSSSQKLLKEKTQFFRHFTSALMFQLKQVPQDMFHDMVEGEDFLSLCLKTFFESVFDKEETTKMDSGLIEDTNLLKQYCLKRFGSKFALFLETETDDDAPTIVVDE